MITNGWTERIEELEKENEGLKKVISNLMLSLLLKNKSII